MLPPDAALGVPVLQWVEKAAADCDAAQQYLKTLLVRRPARVTKTP